MTTFVLEINPETREELYSDYGEIFIGFILIEALHNILKVKRPGISEVLDQIEFPLDLPEDHPELGLAENVAMEIDASVEYLLEVLQQLDTSVGTFLPEEDYQFGSFYYEIVHNKLSIAIMSLEESNPPSQLHALTGVFNSPRYENGFSFKINHCPDRIVVVLLTSIGKFGPINRSLAALLEGGNPEGNLGYHMEGELLAMSDHNTMNLINTMLGG